VNLRRLRIGAASCNYQHIAKCGERDGTYRLRPEHVALCECHWFFNVIDCTWGHPAGSGSGARDERDWLEKFDAMQRVWKFSGNEVVEGYKVNESGDFGVSV